MPVISARNLVKDYGSFRAVKGVDFDIEEGENFGFLGPNGAGKTTVMRTIYCYHPPTEGTVTVLGMDVTEEPSGIKALEGVMPQDENLDPDLTSLENLFVYARYFGIPKKVSVPRARELLRFVELAEKADVNVQRLSGGMKRRLLLARALINEPRVLILDEPTTGMDPHGRHKVWENLSALKEKKVTLVVTTHYMDEAQRICDRVAIMDDGLIVAVDTPAGLMKAHGAGNLEDVYLTLTGRALRE
ncbi:MAG: ABC transporter ATP-binding protein [Nitrospirota bacterium]|jgi:lipooligosaccharide transport system ATP-binding protein